MFWHYLGEPRLKGAPGAALVSLGLTVLVMAALFGWPKSAGAFATVGSGTPLSCNEGALNTALLSGGQITFNCGPFPVEIAVSSQKTIVSNTSIDGGGLVFLTGKNTSRIFNVPSGLDLDLLNLTLYEGKANGDSGGLIYAGGQVRVGNTSLVSSTASVAGGAVYVGPTGSFLMVGGSLSANSAISNGGAIFQDGGPVTIRRTTVQSNTSDSGGAIYNQAGALTIDSSNVYSNSSTKTGGAIVSIGSLTIVSSVLQSNVSRNSSGGAVTAAGTFTITSSRFVTNTASTTDDQGRGGGLRVTTNPLTLAGASGWVTDTSFLSNSAAFNGGGLSVEAGANVVRVARSTFAFNRVNGTLAMPGSGGGLDVLGSAYVVNSTFFGNLASYGGGLSSGYGGVSSVLSITHATIVTNTALNAGGGVYEGGGDLKFRGTVATANFTQDCRVDAGTQGSDGFNWITTPGNCTFTELGDLPELGSPRLGLLRENGGPTLTLVPNQGSPLMNKIAAATGCPPSDQRGIPRPQGSGCDIGAIEYGAVPTVTNVSTLQNLLVTTITLNVTGLNFVYGDVVRWNGVDMPTTFLNGNTLAVTTTASSIPQCGPINVTVFNPGTDGGSSTPFGFSLNCFQFVPMAVMNYEGGW